MHEPRCLRSLYLDGAAGDPVGGSPAAAATVNSIKRGRRRPRVESVSFQSLAWVLVREAFVGLVQFRSVGVAGELPLRRWLCTLPSDRVHELAELVLRRHPDWRVK